MNVGDEFKTFCDELMVGRRINISNRYKAITRRLNTDFWNTTSEESHSLYVGSYGRGTAIDGDSDVDMIFQLAYSDYLKYDGYSSNGQSALLQEVRKSIKRTYSVTDVGADGQVVVVPFDDGIKFEVVPAFSNKDDSFTYPDSNDGGKWRTTNPKPEINAMYDRDEKYNWNLRLLCKMARAWKATWDVPIGGLLIDTLAYGFIDGWKYSDKSYMYYDWMSRDFFEYLSNQNEKQSYWLSPGAGQYVHRKGNFEYKAKRCYNLAVAAIAHEQRGENWSARQRWREIYGNSFPE